MTKVLVEVEVRPEDVREGWAGDVHELGLSIRAALREVIGDDGNAYVPTTTVVGTEEAEPEEADPREFDLDGLAKAVRAELGDEVPVEAVPTGGNVATLYVGHEAVINAFGDTEYPITAGPGWYEDTGARAHLDEFAAYVTAEPDDTVIDWGGLIPTVEQMATAIADLYRTLMGGKDPRVIDMDALAQAVKRELPDAPVMLTCVPPTGGDRVEMYVGHEVDIDWSGDTEYPITVGPGYYEGRHTRARLGEITAHVTGEPADTVIDWAGRTPTVERMAIDIANLYRSLK